jgi:hypothetical protein
VAGGWRRLHDEELQNLEVSANIIRVIKSNGMRFIGHRPCMDEIGNAYKILVRKPERKTLL